MAIFQELHPTQTQTINISLKSSLNVCYRLWGPLKDNRYLHRSLLFLPCLFCCLSILCHFYQYHHPLSIAHYFPILPYLLVYQSYHTYWFIYLTIPIGLSILPYLLVYLSYHTYRSHLVCLALIVRQPFDCRYTLISIIFTVLLYSIFVSAIFLFPTCVRYLPTYLATYIAIVLSCSQQHALGEFFNQFFSHHSILKVLPKYPNQTLNASKECFTINVARFELPFAQTVYFKPRSSLVYGGTYWLVFLSNRLKLNKNDLSFY